MLSKTGGILLVPQMTEAAVAMGRVVARRYLVGRELGSGTMGTVFAAFDLDLDKEVAIKFVNMDELPPGETIERFRREVRVAARIKSEHVVRVLDVGSLDGGAPFMVMELLEGRGLDAERNERGVFPVEEAVGFLLPAIEVLAEAHAAGVVHRDVKPANLFLEDRADGPFLKVLDFGVSKSGFELASRERAITKTGTIMGSPLYMAPEQLRSTHGVDARADIWSLGAILYELVTGFTAHEGESLAELCATLLRDPPRPITDFGSELPPGFAEVVMCCLEPDPERRYANVAELGEALLPFAPSGALHVERARRVLARGATDSIEPGERAPSSDSPVTLELDTAAQKLARSAPGSSSKPSAGTVRLARMAVAFTLVGVGVGTGFVIEFQGHVRAKPVVHHASLAPRPVAAPVPLKARSPLPPLSSILSTSVDSASAAKPAAPAPVAEPKRALPPRMPLRKAIPRQRPAARLKAAASTDVTDFGGRR